MGGKTTQSTNQVTVPPDVLARYDSVNATAQQAATQPFQQYSTNPDAFVAPLTSTQQSGIAGTNAAANQAQPYFDAATGQLVSAQNTATPYYGAATNDLSGAQAVGTGLGAASLQSLAGANSAAQPLQSAAGSNFGTAYQNAQPANAQAAQGYSSALQGAQPYNAGATGLALAGSQAVNASQLSPQAIQQYLSPYLSTVLGSTSALLNQNNQQQQAGQLGSAIQQGAFGGDRAGIAAANLEQQQNLANANIYSGILNTGYGQALSTAQQQQGVNLGAAQANRSALQTASGQLQGIGQQQYAQGTGTAAAQAALGQQQYAQGMGLGTAQQGLASQEFGQGATTSAQQAALSQQLFGQGLSASQQSAALGSGLYGMGAQTAQSLANLGTGAQGAALQGAQAQLAAGQVQQQTQQAGDTALYNQFLQQQSYPFQTAQFLANIAEGTGALSGSTTTSTQPGGFFSDERLKEDIEPIGKTFDGQNVVAFRYKGDPRKQIGLIAQEVEKHHPEAVGSYGGFKTVDYDKATRDAASYRGGLVPANDDEHPGQRQKRASGGLLNYDTYPAMPGVSPTDVGAILQAQEQMYAPYSGGLYGSSPSGLPHGGHSYVPDASMPVGHLAVAAPAARAPSGLDQMNEIATLGKDVQGAANTVQGWLPHHPAQTPTTPQSTDLLTPIIENLASPAPVVDMSQGDSAPQYRSGGLVPHRAVGGDTPYDPNGPPSLDIPDDTPKGLSLAVAKPAAQQPSGLSQLLGLGSDVASIAKMIPGLAAGGSVGDGDPADNYVKGLLASILKGPSPDAAPDASASAPPGVSDAPQTPAASAPAGGLAASVPAAPSGGGVVGPSPSTPSSPQSAPGANLPVSATLKAIFANEGTGRNPQSSAQGPYQIINDTFANAFRQMFPDRAAGMSKQDILALRNTPEGNQLSLQMGPWLAKQYATTLSSAGFPVTPGNVYLSHFLGPAGALRVLRADPSTPMADLVSSQAIAANAPIMKGKTAEDVINWTGNAMARQTRRLGLKRGGYADGGDPTDDMTPAVLPHDDAPPSDSAPPQMQTEGRPVDGQWVEAPAGSWHDASAPPVQQQTIPSLTSASTEPEGAKVAQRGPGKGFLQTLEDPNVFIPLLTGIAAMGTAPTVHPLVALAAGLGAGAQAYQGQRQFGLSQQQLAQHQQEIGLAGQGVQTGQMQAATARQQANVAARAQALQTANAYLTTVTSMYQPIAKTDPATGAPLFAAPGAPGGKATYQQVMAARAAAWQSVMSQFPGLLSMSDMPDLPATTGGQNGVSGTSNPAGPVPTAGGAAPNDNGPANGTPTAPAVGAPAGAASAGAGPSAVALPHGISPHSAIGQGLLNHAFDVPLSLPPDLKAQYDNWQHQASIAQTADGVNYANAQISRITSQPAWQNAAAQSATAAQNAQALKTNIDNAETLFNNPTYQSQWTQAMQSLKEIYRTNNIGALSPTISAAASRLYTIMPDWVKQQPGLMAQMNSTSLLDKESALLTMMRAGSSPLSAGAPATTAGIAGQTVPQPITGPAAAWDMLTQEQTNYDAAKHFYPVWDKVRPQVANPAGFMTAFTADNPVQPIADNAKNSTGFFAGMTQADMEQRPRRLTSMQDAGTYSRHPEPVVLPTKPDPDVPANLRGQMRWVMRGPHGVVIVPRPTPQQVSQWQAGGW